MLKKEFKRKDVERARNLIMGKSGASSETQVGYNKKRVEYKEGDVWKENGKTWTIKDGIKQTISKLDAIKKEINMPLCCPKCGKVMKKRLDKPNYRIHKMCFDCVIEFEHKLRINGKYEEYLNQLKLKNRLTEINEMESFYLDLANQNSNSHISEQGEIQRWMGGVDKEKISKDIIDTAEELRKDIKKKLSNKKK
jgi:bacterioferritin-associated ferredoxin